MEAQSVRLALIDRSAGYEATPGRAKLSILADFASDVKAFLRGETKEIDPAQLDVAVREGSLAFETAPLPTCMALFGDLAKLSAGELLEGIDRKRREVVERWQKMAHGGRDMAVKISSHFLGNAIVISSESDYHANDADQWVRVERYIRGEIQDLGGSTNSNAHIRLPSGELLKVATDRDVLRNETVNRLYKIAMLRIRAKYNVLTRELRDAKLVEFIEYAPSVDEGELERLGRRGAEAWKDVADPAAWVDELRGGGSD